MSVVIPLFNCEKFITQCLDSVFNQSYPPVEIIVIDDGSTDESLSLLNTYVSELESKDASLLKTLCTQNLGAASARNLGILESKGDLIAFVDADDVWLSNKLARQVEEIKLRSADFVCAPGLYLRNGLTEQSTPLIDLEDLKSGFVSKFGMSPILPSGLVVKKSALARTGIFDTALKGPSEDYDLNRRIVRELHGSVVSEPLFYYRVHSANTSGGRLDKIKADYRLALAKQCTDNRTSILRRVFLKSQLEIRFLKRWIRSRIK